ncbi:hypothetical protein KC19_6G167500 [Ceratodon purpureus]|uniref:Uncharacterized protein n=1 Tax=Ceratodon purpureus TaxID=3225 RepID=A0A8T0HFE9_CERPU|nr:hypothetical protein KC19_6G167500 [Ceratodon purpureus]KAG0570507.1 hypothetical protein KC19_6G167500 [Ceratodon purpureus]
MWIRSSKLLMNVNFWHSVCLPVCCDELIELRWAERVDCGRKPLRREVMCSAGTGANNEKAQEASGLMKWEDVLKNVNVYIPHAVLASTVLALSYPPSFTWFTTKYYAPALGFLMFAVGVNLSIGDFKHAMERPAPIALGLAGQYILKPLLGVIFAALAVRFLHLPDAIGSGLILCSCVSGAQLSNYATFLTDPGLAPLSIVMTALSTALAVVVTPLLTLWLLGKRLPIDLVGMITNITKIVVAPIAGGLFLNRFLPQVSRLIRPYLPLLSLLVTCCCVGSPLSVNINAVRSPFGLQILLPVVAFHTAAFIIGYKVTEVTFPRAADISALARTISFETGMQSSLLGLALANRFFPDPMVGLPSAISVVIMSLMAFGLVIYWNRDKHP